MPGVEWVPLVRDSERLRMYFALKIVGENVLVSVYVLEFFEAFFDMYVLILLFLNSKSKDHK